MQFRLVSNFLPFIKANATGGIIHHGFPHSSALNISVNVFAFLIANSLVTFRANPQYGFSYCDLCNVILNNPLVVPHAVNLRAVFEGLVDVAVNLYLSFHASDYKAMRLLVNENRSKDSFYMKEDSGVVLGLNLISDGLAMKLYLFLRSHTYKVHHFLNKSRGFLKKNLARVVPQFPCQKILLNFNYN